MKVTFEFNINKLISRPEFGIDIFVEVNYLLIELSFGDIRGLDKEWNPVVSTVAIKVGCMEIISVNEISATLIDKDNDVNLILSINKFTNSLVD